MLDLETINAVARSGDFSACALYHAEVERLARFSREEQEALVARARQGQAEARQLLLLNCLRWTLLCARRIYHERRPLHVDMLDLAAEANVKMVEKVDKALSASDPVAYLMTIAANEIRVCCTYRAPLIQRPAWFSRQDLAACALFLPPVERLDESYHTAGHSEQPLIAPALDLVTQAQQDCRDQTRFAPLYHALEHLSPTQRATTIRLYGLGGQPAETPHELAASWRLRPWSVGRYARQARRRLAQLLAHQLSQMR